MQQELDKYIDLCRIIIGDTIHATDEQIDNAVRQFAGMFPAIDKLEVKKRLMSLYTLPIAPYKTLLDSTNPGAGWLTKNSNARQLEIEWCFWERYKKYIREKQKFQPGVIFQLDKSTSEILDNLFDPSLIDTNFSKKGLVVGQVQAGKTSNFSGLICKAVDAGFNVIIVFAGILDDLRTQTQNRLEKCFLGFTTKDIEKIKDYEKIGIGVGLIDNKPIAHAFTTIVSDFKESTVNSLGTNFQTKEPILFVVKKNGRILGNLKNWLSKKDLDGKSVLFIDDEADNASVNTSKSKNKASAINGKIREILGLFRRNAYVGYTATPYANIFIDRNNENDLFPRHFIVNLPTPPAYLSPEKVFGIHQEDEQPLPIVNIVKDYRDFVPDKHKIEDIDILCYQNIPDSLKYAIRCFILACAVRCARGHATKHNSMLIHLSRYQTWQNEIKSLISRLFKYYKNEILADDSEIYELLRRDYEENYTCGYGNTKVEYKSFVQITSDVINSQYTIIKEGIRSITWEEVKKHLYYVVSKIEIKALNGASTDSLLYDEHEDDGYYVIAIGGDKLSRGLTLEGLSISYFLRASKMYDTLMQMGRWFGYRPQYVDVCRLFISEEINYWFKNITIANNELREDFDYLWESKGSPQEYAMKVRTSPGLLITSPLKMVSTKDVQISWASTLVETYSLRRNRESLERNYQLTSSFLGSLGDRYQKDGKDDPRGYLWINVCPDVVCDFIENFEIAESSRIKMDLEKMSKYIKTCVNEFDELKSWRVILRNQETKEDYHLNPDKSVYYMVDGKYPGICTNRTRVGIPDQDDDIYNLKNYHLISGPKDEFLDMYMLDEDLSEAYKETIRIKKEQHIKNPSVKEWKESYPSPTLVRQRYRSSNSPLLIIYPLNPEKANVVGLDGKIKEDVVCYKRNDLPFIAFAIVFPQSKNAKGVKYKVNEVKDLIETEINFEATNDNKYSDEE